MRGALSRRAPSSFLWAWGESKLGGLAGLYTAGAISFPYPQQGAFSNVAQVQGGPGKGFVLLRNRTLWGYGNNYSGELGQGYEFLPAQGELVAPFITTPVCISGGTVLYTKETWTNEKGEHFERPLGPTGPPVANVIALGYGSPCCALLGDGRVLAWGGNLSGQLGNGYFGLNHIEARIDRKGEEEGTFRPQWSPWWVQTGGPPQGAEAPQLTGVKAVCGGWGSFFYLKANNEVLYTGQPVGVPQHLYAAPDERIVEYAAEAGQYVGEGGLGGAKITAISSSKSNVMLLLDNGTIRVVGTNEYGQRGEGAYGKNKGESKEGTGIGKPALTEIVAVGAGEYHNIALDAKGNVWAWGRNQVGQLGRGTIQKFAGASEAEKLEMVSVKKVLASEGVPLANVMAIGTAGEPEGPAGSTLGSWYNVALLSDHTMRMWGGNEEGQLGDLTLENKGFPVQPNGNLQNVQGVFPRSTHMNVMVRTGKPFKPSISATLETIAGKKWLRVKWTPFEPSGVGHPALRPEEFWHVSVRRVEKNPATGKQEKNHQSLQLAASTTEYLAEVPPPEWEGVSNLFEVEVKGGPPTETLHGVSFQEKVGTMLWHIKWNPGGANPPEAGWFPEWRREETYINNKGKVAHEAHTRHSPEAQPNEATVEIFPFKTPPGAVPAELVSEEPLEWTIEGAFKGSFRARTVELEVP